LEDEFRERVLALLRTKGLRIRGLDPARREVVRSFLEQLHVSEGVSLSDVAKLIGNKSSGYTSWLCRQVGVKARPFEEARLRGIREKRRKYERRPFDGSDEDRAYMLGLRHGDLSASRPWNGAVRVSTSTTHPAMSGLFRALFEPYGHVYQHPRYKKDTRTYEWNLSTILDGGFEFLLEDHDAARTWAMRRHGTVLSYLAGLLDAEGTIGIYPAKRYVSLNVIYYNTDLSMLKFVIDSLELLGLHPLPPYLDKKKGSISPGYKIEVKKDYWRVLLARFDECQRLLEVLPIRHAEKCARKTLVLRLSRRQPWQDVVSEVQSIKASITRERNAFTGQARDLITSRGLGNKAMLESAGPP
jgi:hypothetical protein